MSFNFNLAALTESARDRLARLETQGSALRGRILSPASRVSAGSPVVSRGGVAFPSSPPRAAAAGGLSIVSGGGGVPGEFLPSSGVSGGGAAVLSVFEMTADLHGVLCLGVVGNGLKFCTLGANQCSFTTHSKKAATDVGSLYIASGRNSAFARHSIRADLLSHEQLSAVLAEKHTREEWVYLFHVWNNQASTSTANVEAVGGLGVRGVVSAIKPPKRVRLEEPLGVSVNLNLSDYSLLDNEGEDKEALGVAAQDLTPDLVFLSSTSSEEKTQEERLEDMMRAWDPLIQTIKNLASSFRSIQKKHAQSVEVVDERASALESMLGHCTDHQLKEDCITVWDAISFLHSNIEGLGKELKDLHTSKTTQENVVNDKFKSLEDSVQATFTKVSQSFQELVTFSKVLSDEQALLNLQVKEGIETDGGLAELKKDIQALSSKLSALETHYSSPFHQPSPMTEEITALKIQVKMLESRIPIYNLLRLGGMTFQSQSEVAVFVENKVPPNSFAMFQDIVTLMERLSGTYVERKEVINEWYQATKVGLDEREARHVASFKITYPTVFGYIKEVSSSSKHHLPAVKTFKDWNSFDCETGVKAFILNGMEDLKLQLYQDIINFFLDEKFYDAKMLAHDMHNKSQIFVAEMCNWMDVFYQELLTTSEATEDEAWELVSGCIKKIFEDLRRVRASAANATSETNPSTKCSIYLWALIQSHRVMKDYIDARFRNHPSIAPVIILHVFKTRVTRVAHSNHVKRLEGRLAKLESSINKPPKGGPKAGKDPDNDKTQGKN
jgi:hypothetical protein